MSPIANMLVQIKNAQAVGKTDVVIPFSNMKLAIATILQEEGFVGSVETKKSIVRKTELPFLHVALKYHDGIGAINGVRLVSKPSRRMYAHAHELQNIKSGFGISLVSTSQGVMTGTKARKLGVGGEVLFELW